MYICVCTWAYMCVCTHACIYVPVHVETRGWCPMSSTIPLHLLCGQGFYLNLEFTDLATLNDQQGLEVLLSLLPSTGVTGIHCYTRVYHRGTEVQAQVFMLYSKSFANGTIALTPTLALFFSSANNFTHDAKRIFPKVTLLSPLCSQAFTISLLSPVINSVFYHPWPYPSGALDWPCELCSVKLLPRHELNFFLSLKKNLLILISCTRVFVCLSVYAACSTPLEVSDPLELEFTASC